MTREAWLQSLAGALAPILADADLPTLPPLRVSCGWPASGGLGRGKRTIGQCWAPEVSADGHAEVFVSPVLADGPAVAAVLLHELIHAAIGTDKGHGPAFRRAALACGLAGPMTATVPSDALAARLLDILAGMDPYPHAAMDPSARGRRQSTRMVKVTCPCCGYVVRTTRRWLETGLPACPDGTTMEPSTDDLNRLAEGE